MTLFINSENYASENVRKHSSSILTNKYAEGYPGKRYYGGCEVVDQIENLAIEKGKSIFKSDHINVQPHSGSQANMAAYVSFLKPGPSREEALNAVRTLISWAGDNPDREGLLETPDRVIRSYGSFFGGYDEDPEAVLGKTFEEVEGYDVF